MDPGAGHSHLRVPAPGAFHRHIIKNGPKLSGGRNVSRRRLLMILCGLMLLAAVPGCGGCGVSGRGKNSDFDRPKAADKK